MFFDMCYRPISIRNSKPDKNPLLDRVLLHVPCGHCIQCKDEKRNSMWIRSFYEFQETKLLNGYCIFITLTYRNNTIPRLNNDIDFKCFNKKDVQKYIKRFRQRLQRRFPEVYIKDCVKYLLTSEFGGTTHRPHYHLLVYIKHNLPRWVVRRLLADCWSFGFTKFGSRNYGFIDSVGGLYYVCKYITKDVYEEDYFKKFFEDYCKKYVGAEYSQEIARKYLKPFMPFYLVSNNFGIYALASIDDDDLYLGRILMPDSKVSEKYYKLPLYYDRKFFYDVQYKFYDEESRRYIYSASRPACDDFTPVYTLNSKGSTMKIARCENFYKAAENVYINAIQLNPDFNILSFNEHFKTNFETPSQLSSFIKKKIDKDTYCRYNLLYSGVNIPLLDSVTPQESTSFAEDYSVIMNLKSGLQVLQRDIDSFMCNCAAHHDVPHIDLVSEMIGYSYYLCQKSFENKRNKEELDYVHRKSLHLQYSEAS